jgi:predicted DNA-binding protein (MmcQ/YjbR family)
MPVLQDLRQLLASLPGAAEEYPFKLPVRVFKVGGKMFAVTPTDDAPGWITLKGTPEDNEMDQAEFRAVRPAWHMNKRHWYTVTLDGSVPGDVLAEMIRASYALVVHGLPRTRRPAQTNEGGSDHVTA